MHSPRPCYIAVPLPQQARGPQRSRTSTAPSGAQQADCADGRQRSACLPANVQPKLKTALKIVIKPKLAGSSNIPAADTMKGTRKTGASVKRCLAAVKAAAPNRLQQLALKSAQPDLCPSDMLGAVKVQAHALMASARAVLKGLDWADSQLACSTAHPTASAPAGDSSTASSNPFERYRIAAVAAGRAVAGDRASAKTDLPAADAAAPHGEHLPSASAEHTTAQPSNQHPADRGEDSVAASLQQPNIDAARHVEAVICSAQQSGHDSFPDSSATWSDSDNAGHQSASVPHLDHELADETSTQKASDAHAQRPEVSLLSLLCSVPQKAL